MSSVFLPPRMFEGGGLPSEYVDGGYTVSLKTDFRVWLRYEYLRDTKDLSDEEKALACLKLCLDGPEGGVPANILFDALQWFYTCGDSERVAAVLGEKKKRERDSLLKAQAGIKAHRPPAVSLFWDFWQLWVSFKTQYGVDLYSCESLHWWEFKRLLLGLDAESALGNVQGFRKLTKDQYLQRQAGMKAQKEREWGYIELEQKFSALPK